MARPLNPDLPAWEQQAEEPVTAYEGFLAYRDSEERRVTDHGVNAKRWSAQWSWAYRVLEWDRYMHRLDQEQLVRYRMTMNERHRAIGRLAQAKAATWLQNLDPERIARMKPAEVVRMLEVAARLEREASGAGMPEHPMDDELAPEMGQDVTLGDLLGSQGMTEAQAAAALHTLLAGRSGVT